MVSFTPTGWRETILVSFLLLFLRSKNNNKHGHPKDDNHGNYNQALFFFALACAVLFFSMHASAKKKALDCNPLAYHGFFHRVGVKGNNLGILSEAIILSEGGIKASHTSLFPSEALLGILLLSLRSLLLLFLLSKNNNKHARKRKGALDCKPSFFFLTMIVIL